MNLQHIIFSTRNTLATWTPFPVAQPLLAVLPRLSKLPGRDLSHHPIQEMVSRSIVPANMLPGGERR